MKSIRSFLLLGILAVTLNGSSAYCTAPAVAGQAVVKVAAAGATRGLSLRTSITIIDSIPELRVYLVEFGPESALDSVVNDLKGAPNVLYAEPNNLSRLPNVQQVSIGFPDQDRPIFSLGTNPPSFYEQPGVYNTGIDSARALADGSGVLVAVLDNGVTLDHPLMQTATVLPGYDFLDNDSDPSEEEGFMHGHGTFVSGLVLLTSPGCSLLPVRVMSGDGVGCEFSLAKALVWTQAQGARVANLSLGSEARSNLLADAVAYVIDRGMALVVSAGNESSARPMYPAALDDVTAVGAVDTTELLADFSSFGQHLALVAPGVNLYSSLAGEFEWGTWSGTSFSAPLVTGTMALMLQIEPALSPDQLHTQLARTARRDLLWGTVDPEDTHYGAGMLNALEAVRTLQIGDLDESGFADRADLGLLIAYVRSGQNPDGAITDLTRADIDCNGRVTMSDVSLLAAIITHSPRLRRLQPCLE